MVLNLIMGEYIFYSNRKVGIFMSMEELIEGLNEDLSHEYGAAIQYSYSASVVTGIHRPSLKPFFESEITDELGHAMYLSEKIRALGGQPTTKAANVRQRRETQD